MDQVNGELSVGHSFVFGGDLPEVESPSAGVLGADFVADQGRWRIERILTFESWNPEMKAPLDRPRSRGRGRPLSARGRRRRADRGRRSLPAPGRHTAGRQTVLRLGEKPDPEGSWTVIVEPLADESDLRRRAWVEDNRRRVDELSNGKLAYVWVPNTGTPGVVSFDRYFFAQQDKLGAVIRRALQPGRPARRLHGRPDDPPPAGGGHQRGAGRPALPSAGGAARGPRCC